MCCFEHFVHISSLIITTLKSGYYYYDVTVKGTEARQSQVIAQHDRVYKQNTIVITGLYASKTKTLTIVLGSQYSNIMECGLSITI